MGRGHEAALGDRWGQARQRPPGTLARNSSLTLNKPQVLSSELMETERTEQGLCCPQGSTGSSPSAVSPPGTFAAAPTSEVLVTADHQAGTAGMGTTEAPHLAKTGLNQTQIRSLRREDQARRCKVELFG